VETQQQVVAPVQQVPVTAEPDLSTMFAPTPAPEPAPQPAVVDPAQAQPIAPAPQPQPAPTPTVPLPEHLEERHRRQMAERELQYAREQQAQIQRAWEAQQRAMQPQPQPIDPIAEPERAWAALQERNAALERQMQEQAVHQRANMSEMLARREHGPEKVDAAVQAALQAGLNRNFMAQPDPYAALMSWHNSQTIAQQVGPDLKAWEARKEAEILARYGIKPGTPPVATAPLAAAPQNLPPSLAGATRANVASPVEPSANDFFSQMMAPRKR
jgi:hypothetical protein